jgi:Zn-dependent protease/predicted transcriptional regulator
MPNSLKVATVGGIDIYINWSWLLAVAFITWSLGSYYQQQFPAWGAGSAYTVGAISAVLLFVTVLIHELAHSFTARARGLPVQTIYLFIYGGVSNLSREPETPGTELVVAIAGPLASVSLAGLFFLLHAGTGSAPAQVGAVLGYLALVNLILAIFNLIPGFPLDGGRVLHAVIWMITGNLYRATQIATRLGSGIGYVFIAGGLLEALLLRQVFDGILLAFVGWFLHNSASASSHRAWMDRVLLGVNVSNVMDAIQNTVSPDTPVEALIYRHLLDENQRAVPVVAPDGALLGLVTLGDTRETPRQDWSLIPVSRIMTPRERLSTVSPDDSLSDALRVLGEHSYHQLPVEDHGRLVGMLHRGHVVQYLHVRQRLATISPDAALEQEATGTPPEHRVG